LGRLITQGVMKKRRGQLIAGGKKADDEELWPLG
jgi:hypothetical protein